MPPPALSRRRFLELAAASTTVGVARWSAPFLSRAADRPLITHGLQSGDISADSAIVWARTDRPARMLVDAATSDRFRNILQSVAVDTLAESDFTAKALLDRLPAGQEIFYRVAFQDLSEPTIVGEQMVGRFRTAPIDRRSVSFVWSGDTVGQGWGIDEARGGMKTYATMLGNRPDFFIHSGDTVYADDALQAEVKLPDGGIWKNVLTEEKSRAAQTLEEFRGQYKYNLIDTNLREFNAAVPMLAQWDDHEVTNNWWPGEPLDSAEHRRKKYTEKTALALAARASRAFHEYMPMRDVAGDAGRVYRKISYGPLLDIFMLDMRSYRGPNRDGLEREYGPPAYFLGPRQVSWLKEEVSTSRATWKVIAADMPIGLVIPDDFERRTGTEGIAQGNGPALGRELELADLLSSFRRSRVHNVIWITADVHYTAAHYYDPNGAQFQDFDPFWEFVSGPIHAGAFGPNALDNTFGPQVRFQKTPAAREIGQRIAVDGSSLQFFGHVAIDGRTGVLTVTLKDADNKPLWSVGLEPVKP